MNAHVRFVSVIKLSLAFFLTEAIKSSCHTSQTPSSDGLCSTIISVNGYACKEYTVTTDDGYILGIQRIPFGADGQALATRPPVFLQHGLLQGGDDWVLNPPNQALAFMLADSGFDVWIGNHRGTAWSHGHVSRTVTDPEFWDFSWEELAAFDLPTMLELVYSVTGQKIRYVGHSQGTLIALAALSEHRLDNLVKSAALLSPIAYMSHITSRLISALARLYVDSVYRSSTGNEEFNAKNPLDADLIFLACLASGMDCSDLLTAVTGPNCCLNSSRLGYYVNFEPQPTSTKNLAHFSQMIRTGNMSKYDYGREENLRRYSQAAPPEYDLSSIEESMIILLAYGGRDYLSDTQDVEQLTRALQCRVEQLFLPEYGHADFILGTEARFQLYQPLIDFFKLN